MIPGIDVDVDKVELVHDELIDDSDSFYTYLFYLYGENISDALTVRAYLNVEC